MVTGIYFFFIIKTVSIKQSNSGECKFKVVWEFGFLLNIS